MITRSITLIIFLFIGACTCNGQVIGDDAKCPPDKIFSKSEIEPVYKPGIDSMKLFFSNLTFPPTTKGQIELNIIVCYQGDLVSSSIINKTNTELDEELLKKWLSLMTGWKPGVQNGRYISFMVNIVLTINEGIVIRVKSTIGSETKNSS